MTDKLRNLVRDLQHWVEGGSTARRWFVLGLGAALLYPGIGPWATLMFFFLIEVAQQVEMFAADVPFEPEDAFFSVFLPWAVTAVFYALGVPTLMPL